MTKNNHAGYVAPSPKLPSIGVQLLEALRPGEEPFQELGPGTLLVVCHAPGLRRGGMIHPHRAIHAVADLEEWQITAMRRDPDLVLIHVA
ncbi:hypothetical protein E3E12_06035 [Formicincola oecophyllae]|uniref:Uncharacterized protein n=1 Tax=Formicincola oecophyllae TaxID=2558361 RepID=A0A4Y6UCG9_9PROT|nr:hypothetical protein [Formicincola oecophyllae]QDH13815.1 hypothetical protein E3E12_06035 [Formicincola oecophyllae]